MEIKEYKVGTKVVHNDTGSKGTITGLGLSSCAVEWESGAVSNIRFSDLTPLPPDTPKARVGKIIAYWRRKATEADLTSVRTMVQEAIDACGLDATAKVGVAEEDFYCLSMGHNPIKAEIKLNAAIPAIRKRDGAVVKGMDTITVLFERQAGVYDHAKHFELLNKRHELTDTLPPEEALAAGDALPWEGEAVQFSARTNGKIRGYRCRTWYPYEGGVAGYGPEHLGGHYGYADTWENLKPDFAAYVRAVAHDLGYEGKADRKEVA